MTPLVALLLAASWVEVRPPTGPFVALSDDGDKPARVAINHLEQFRFVLGQAVGQPELKSFWPIVIVVSKPARNAPPPLLAFSRAGYISTWPAGATPSREWFHDLALLLLDASLPGRMPPGMEQALADLVSTLEVKTVRTTLGAPPPPEARTAIWAQLHMLFTNPATTGRLKVLLTNLAQGAEIGAAYRNSFEQSQQQIEEQAAAYLKAGNFQSIPYPGKALDMERFKEIPASPSQVRLVPGDLALARKAPPAEVRTAYQGNHEGLGLVDLFEGDTKAALAEFTLAIQDEYAGPRAWLEYARLVPDMAQALPAFEKAIQLNPAWAEPHFRIAERSDSLNKKAFALKKAVALEPRNKAYWVALAGAYEEQLNFVESVKAWRGAEKSVNTQAERDELHRIQLAREDQRLAQEDRDRRRKAEEERAEVERLKNETLKSIHAAEQKANQAAGDVKNPSKVEKWWDGPPLTKVSATLERVDCLGRQARFVLKTADGKPLQLLIVDPSQIVIMGGGEKTFGCGPVKPPRHVNAEYVAKPNAKLGTAGEAQVIEFP